MLLCYHVMSTYIEYKLILDIFWYTMIYINIIKYEPYRIR